MMQLWYENSEDKKMFIMWIGKVRLGFAVGYVPDFNGF